MTMEKRFTWYETERIVVTFDPNICQHSAVCLSTFPGVFDIRRRQWIMPELAEPESWPQQSNDVLRARSDIN